MGKSQIKARRSAGGFFISPVLHARISLERSPNIIMERVGHKDTRRLLDHLLEFLITKKL
jgi:hypothetical protein